MNNINILFGNYIKGVFVKSKEYNSYFSLKCKCLFANRASNQQDFAKNSFVLQQYEYVLKNHADSVP